MGNAQPVNKTNQKATAKKFANAKKLGILSLSEHSLNVIPDELFSPDLVSKLRTLDLSKNELTQLGKLACLTEIKSLNLGSNQLPLGSLKPISLLLKLQSFSAGNNLLGKRVAKNSPSTKSPAPDVLPAMPPTLCSVNLRANYLTTIPSQLVSASLVKLERLDLSKNQIAEIPSEISALSSLEDLNLDDNCIVELPDAIGQLKRLKVLSLRNNKLRSKANTGSSPNRSNQSLPQSLFENTLLIDLNLHGNTLTNTEVNQFKGFDAFLDRRQKVKSKTFANLDVCGLE